MFASSLVLALVVGTWNGEWFPSGRAEHRANDQVERATIRAAGQMLADGISEVDPSGKEDILLCLSEIRDLETAQALCTAIGRTNLAIAVVTAYRRRDRFDQQQDVIMTTLPVAKANWSRWKTHKDTIPPRGYAHAEVVVSPAVTATVYAVHLKSNYGQTSEAIAQTNRLKRAYAIEQLVEQEKPKRGKFRAPVIIAGDFNADRFSKSFEKDTMFQTLLDAGFVDAFEGVPKDGRITHPGSSRHAGSTLDYIFMRGCGVESPPKVIPALRISDHDAVFVKVGFPQSSPKNKVDDTRSPDAADVSDAGKF